VFDISENYRRSAKIEAIMKHITEAINSNKKCVVFSHFHPMILLLEHDLELNNINFLVHYFIIFQNPHSLLENRRRNARGRKNNANPAI